MNNELKAYFYKVRKHQDENGTSPGVVGVWETMLELVDSADLPSVIALMIDQLDDTAIYQVFTCLANAKYKADQINILSGGLVENFDILQPWGIYIVGFYADKYTMKDYLADKTYLEEIEKDSYSISEDNKYECRTLKTM